MALCSLRRTLLVALLACIDGVVVRPRVHRSLTVLRGGQEPLPEGALAFPAETIANRADPDDASSGDDELIQQVYDQLELEEVLEAAGSKLVIIDFFAPWCKPCKMIAPVLEELARKAKGKVVFLKVDTDESQDLAQEHKIKSMPTFHLYKNGKKIDSIRGANEFLLRQRVGDALKHPLLKAVASPIVALPLLLGYLVVYART